MKKLLIPIVALALAGGFIQRAHGALLAYEGFDYPDGSNVEGQNGGFGWASPWEFQAFYSTNVTGSLSYTDGSGNVLNTSGNKLYNVGEAAGTSASQPGRTLTNYFTDGGTYNTTNWFSFLGQRLGVNYVRGANIALFNTNSTIAFPGSEKLDIGENSTVAADCWMFRAPNNADNPGPTINAVSTNAFNLLTLVVIRIDHITNDIPNSNITNDNVFLWINPALNTEPSTATAATNISSLKDFSFNRLRFFASGLNGANAAAEWHVDELRLGDTFADVTPYTPGASGNLATRWTNWVISGSSLSLTLTGKVSTVYRVLGATNLTQSPWNVVGNLTTDANGVGSITNVNALTTYPLRFYGVDVP